MPMYNYFDMRGKLEADRNFILPADINKPVSDYFKSIGCNVAVKWIERVQKNVMCNRLELVSKKDPAIRIKIQADFGMIEGYDKISNVDLSEWEGKDYGHIKNTNLSKRKVK